MHPAPASLLQHTHDIWLARGAVLVTAALNAFLINDLTVFPAWLASTVELALLVPLSLTAAEAQTLPQMLQQSQQTVGQAVPGRLSGQTANGGGADNSLAPSQIDRLLGNETQINREGSATEAEGGANATGPLAEPDRFPGPTRSVFGASLFTRNSPSAIDAPTSYSSKTVIS